MTKNCARKVTELKNGPTIINSVMQDSTRGPMCTVHKSMKSTCYLPHPQHQSIQLRSMPNRCCQQNSKVATSCNRSKCQNMSPKECTSEEIRSALCAQNWSFPPPCHDRRPVNQTSNPSCVTFACPSPNCPSRKCSSRLSQQPSVLSAGYVNIEKVNSCPERTCSCASRFSINSASKALDRNFIQSQSSTLSSIGSVGEIRTQMAQHFVCTDGAVTELKDEIDKVKCQLHLMKIGRADKLKTPKTAQDKNDPQTVISHLKAENKQLKKELIQKRKLQQTSVKNVEKAKDIMNDYEKKVSILHEQAMKSSKVMKHSKDKFCKCLQDKEEIIKELQKNNENLTYGLKDQAVKYAELEKMYESLQDAFDDNNARSMTLSGNNDEYVQCIEMLRKQLETALSQIDQYKEDIRNLKQDASDAKCTTCQKLEAKIKKQKEKYEIRLKEQEDSQNMFKSQISILSNKLKEMESENLTIEQLQCKCDELHHKLIENDKCVSKYKQMEEKCRRQCETTQKKENRFIKERDEMRQLVDELTTVVKQNKVTLLQLSNINKQQEELLESQCSVLSQKEERIRMAESTIEILQTKSSELEKEVEGLKVLLSGPCTRETCCSLSRELEDIKVALNLERDNHLMKQKIIEDQSQTISTLQVQIKEKMSELSKAREETSKAEMEMARINDDLARKHEDLERELDEKENLLDKMRKLEHQKTQLSYEMEELEKLLQRYCESQHDEKQEGALKNLQKQLEAQRHDWEAQKQNLAVEKEKAVCAAKFATQKLLDTVSDFQRQVDAQKKVQTMLTKMLHNKEEELKIIRSKMSSINTIVSDVKTDISMKELYKRTKEFDLSNPATQTSFYSSCSNCSKTALKKSSTCERTDIQKLFNLLTSSDKRPLKPKSQ